MTVKETDFDANKEMVKSYFGIGWTKVYLEKMCEFYSRLGTTKYTVLRHSNIYGPYDKYDLEKSHVFGATMTKVLTNNDGKITVWGSGEAARDLLYIDDLAVCVRKAIQKQETAFELFNVGCGSAVSVKDLVGKIIKISEKKAVIELDRTKPDIKTKLCLDISKVKEKTGWVPETSLDDGIKKTIEW
ncbi:MAG: NAD-dependent epimerase/dehydratase family protein, partial [Candidatus Margulisiibacteriota bacterium]